MTVNIEEKKLIQDFGFENIKQSFEPCDAALMSEMAPPDPKLYLEQSKINMKIKQDNK